MITTAAFAASSSKVAWEIFKFLLQPILDAGYFPPLPLSVRLLPMTLFSHHSRVGPVLLNISRWLRAELYDLWRWVFNTFNDMLPWCAICPIQIGLAFATAARW